MDLWTLYERIDLEEEGDPMVENQWINAYINRGDHPMTNAGLEIKKNLISAEEKGEKPTGDPILLLKEKEFLGMMKPQPSS
jgi:hypothetical protein